MSTHGNLLLTEKLDENISIRLHTHWDGDNITTIQTLLRVPETIITNAKENKAGLSFFQSLKTTLGKRKNKKYREEMYQHFVKRQAQMRYVDMDACTMATFVIVDSPRWMPNPRMDNGKYYFDHDHVNIRVELEEAENQDKLVTIHIDEEYLKDEDYVEYIQNMVNQANKKLHFSKFNFEGNTISYHFNQIFADLLTNEFVK